MTMDDFRPRFCYATCQRGAESALKWSIGQTRPLWRLAFSCPGLVTFKLDTRLASEASPASDTSPPPSPFARTAGYCLGPVRGSQLDRLAKSVWELDSVAALCRSFAPLSLHVWQTDLDRPGRHGFEPGPTALSCEVEQAVRQAAATRGLAVSSQPASQPVPLGAMVVDVVIAEPGDWWIGCHRASNRVDRWPGGVIPIQLPAHAVSRAYLKMEESLRWSGLPITSGDEVVEIGCAPGGASQALLDRGLLVTGIDPAKVADVVLAHPNFRYINKRGSEVRRREFRHFRWLTADMNVAPTYTLDTVEAVVAAKDVCLRGLLLTLKLADPQMARQVDSFVERVRSWGFRDVRVRQLAHHGQELGLVALRSRSQRRVRRRVRKRSTPPTQLA